MKESKYEDLLNLGFIVFLVLLLSFFIFIFLWRNIQMANLELEIENLKKEKKKLHLEVESIHVSITRNTTPEKIEQILSDHEIYLPVRTGKKIISIKLPPADIFNGSKDAGQNEGEAN